MTPPSVLSAQVCWEPAAIWATVGTIATGGDVGTEVVVGVPDGDDVAVVVGLEVEVDAQAATRSPTTIVDATLQRDKRIPCPPVGSRETFGRARCYLDILVPVTVIRQPPRGPCNELHAFEARTHVTR